MENENKESSKLAIDTNKFVWIAGALILLVAGWFGFKAITSPFENYKVTLVDAPKEVTVGSTTTFTWRVDGSPATINHTAVYYGTVSNPGDLEKDVKPTDTKYADFVKDFADGKYDIPLQFVGNTKIDAVGVYYFRVHALVKDKNYWSDEYTFEVKPLDYKVSIINALKEVDAGKIASFTWRVDGPSATINHTSIRFGTVSNPGDLGKDVKPADTNYTELIKDFATGKYDIPLQFVGNVKIPAAGTYYFRGYAVIDDQHYWTDEYTFEAK